MGGTGVPGGGSGPAGPAAEADAESRAPEPLRRLAERWGVETAYRDVSGRRRPAGAEALVRVLRALGAAIEGPEDAPDALRARRLQRWRRPLDPVSVCRPGEPPDLIVRLRAEVAPEELRLAFVREDGSRTEVGSSDLEIREERSREVEGVRWVARRLRLHLPEPPPAGYHRARLLAPGSGGDADPGPEAISGAARAGRLSHVIAAPARCPAPARSRWGIFLPLHALRHGGDWGVGDFPALGRLASWGRSHGAALAGTLPLLAAFLDEPFEPSPYAPASRLFWNEAFVDPRRAPGWEEGLLEDPAAAGPAGEEALRRLRERPTVEWREVARRKRGALETLARRFFAAGGGEEPGYRGFVEERPRVRDYGRFRAAVEMLGPSWRDWPASARGGTLRPRDFGSDAARYHTFVQWVAEMQLREVAEAGSGTGPLYLDLPLGSHPDGYDAWRFRERFAGETSVGAPPDDFFRGGQDWGFPPLHPVRMREGGYAYTAECLRHSLRHAGALRIDHVMGFHRLYWIPADLAATEGVYVRYRADELYAVLCLEAVRAGAAVVGEDLGTVPAEVRREMERRDVAGMYVLPFEVRPDPEGPIPAPARRTLATTATHDTYPFPAFWEGLDIRDREGRGELTAAEAAAEGKARERLRRALAEFLRERGELGESDEVDAGSALAACLAHLAASPARTLMVNLEELWLERRPQNVPGTGPEAGNWRRRARHPLAELRRMPRIGEILRRVERNRRAREAPPEGAPGRVSIGDAAEEESGGAREGQTEDVTETEA